MARHTLIPYGRNMADESISLKALTELKSLRMQACAELQNRTRQPLVYTRSTALELLSIEKPRTPRMEKRDSVAWAVVPSLQRRCHVRGVKYLAWTGPLETQVVGRHYECVTPVCAWAHYAAVLPLDELIVLGESMMRRDKRLKRAEINDFVRFIAGAGRFEGIRRCRLALRVIRENTDSSMETRTRLALMRYGLPAPDVNYELTVAGTSRSLYLDMAYPTLKIAIEYDGNHHRFSSDQVLRDDKRRDMIEAMGWRYLKVTFVDLSNERAEEELSQRVATAMEKALRIPVPLEPRLTIEQVCDGHRLKRKPIWERRARLFAN